MKKFFRPSCPYNFVLKDNESNFGNNHFGQNTREKIFLEVLGEYNGVCSEIFQTNTISV